MYAAVALAGGRIPAILGRRSGGGLRIWIDTDIGSDVDDALALAYALRSPEIELVGLSTVFGDVELRGAIARALLAKAGRHDVPVVTGLGKPLTDARLGLMFGHEGRGLLGSPDPRMRTHSDESGEQRIAALAEELARARPEALVAIGPLTNLGALARSGAPLPPLWIMGGKVEKVMLPGMNSRIEEWNWFCDPIAVQHVLAASAGHEELPRVVPAEITFRTRLEQGDIERMHFGDDLARALSTLCQEWLAFLRGRLGGDRARVLLHDPLAVAALVETGLCPFEPRCLAVDDEGRTTQPQASPNALVAVDVDTDATREHLMATWMQERR